MRLGDSLTTAVAKERHLQCGDGFCKIDSDTIAGVSAFTFLELDGGRVFSVVITFKPADYPTMVAIAREKWGPPTADALDTIANRMGAKFPRRRVRWNMAEGALMLDEYGDRLSESVMMIISDSLLQMRNARDSVRIKNAAKTAM
ncbi:MAG: hypothetical protein JWM95_4017 [Gemmatimonadetes bacterium]|nr:hypothetical protein [Gemmatimonadota bacterium]